MDEDLPTTELGSSDSMSLHLFDEQERSWFHNAFVTEIGGEQKRGITLRELVDVIVCAGKDVTHADLQRIWPYGDGEDKISYEEALHIYQQVPHTNFSDLSQSFATMTVEGALDYTCIIAHIEDAISDETDKEEINGKREVQKWFLDKQLQKFDIEKILKHMQTCQNRLRSINHKIVDDQNRWSSNMNLFPNRSSSESLSSMFSNTRINVEVASNHNSYLANNSTRLSNNGAGSLINSYRESMNSEKVTLKSFVIQRSPSQVTCLSYSFTTFRSQRVRVNISLNEKIDSSLCRFQNHVFGYIIHKETDVIYGITKRKDKATMCTEWLQLPAGTFAFRLKFCRPLKMIEPERRSEILDTRRLLTKPFRVMLMNLFDMFDLDDDGLLSRDEFELYSIVSGSGKLLQGRWEKLKENFELRDGGLSITKFIQMHQKEADFYAPNTYLQNMWSSIRQLGHNSKFFMSTACPLLLEFQLSEGASFSPFEIHESCADAEPMLVDYFWENGTLLPYLKEQPLLRQFKTDYFAVLLAGKSGDKMNYKLDLSMSNGVNIEGNDLIIEKKVPANQLKILTVAIAQADSWYLNVRCNT